MFVHPTPFPDVNSLLDKLLSGVHNILEDNFVGLYLYGSLASGDFDLERSDVDFLVVTREAISSEKFSALEAMHERLANSELNLAKKLEGCYIPRADIRRHISGKAEYPTLNEGKFYLSGLGSDWIIQRHIIREQGVIIAGTPPRDLIDAVESSDLKRAVIGVLNEWWSPMLQHPAWINSDEYQAYAVLTMCRALFTIENGTIASKPVSARWALETLIEHWKDLIEKALSWRHGKQLNKLDEMLDFIRYTVDAANNSARDNLK